MDLTTALLAVTLAFMLGVIAWLAGWLGGHVPPPSQLRDHPRLTVAVCAVLIAGGALASVALERATGAREPELRLDTHFSLKTLDSLPDDVARYAFNGILSLGGVDEATIEGFSYSFGGTKFPIEFSAVNNCLGAPFTISSGTRHATSFMVTMTAGQRAYFARVGEEPQYRADLTDGTSVTIEQGRRVDHSDELALVNQQSDCPCGGACFGSVGPPAPDGSASGRNSPQMWLRETPRALALASDRPHSTLASEL